MHGPLSSAFNDLAAANTEFPRFVCCRRRKCEMFFIPTRINRHMHAWKLRGHRRRMARRRLQISPVSPLIFRQEKATDEKIRHHSRRRALVLGVEMPPLVSAWALVGKRQRR